MYRTHRIHMRTVYPAAGVLTKRLVHLSFVFGLITVGIGLSGCGSSDASRPTSTPTPTSSATATATATPSPTPNDHIQTVFLILMENKNLSEVMGSDSAPYLNNTLLPASSYAENYRGPNQGGLHPSEPNYIWLEAGDNYGITSDNDPAQNHLSVTAHLVNLLEAQGVTWRSYQEDISGLDCPLTGVGNYAPKHNPMVFFDDVINYNTQTMAADPLAPRCLAHVRPLGELMTDLQSGSAARYNFITPNECNDMHSTCAPLNDEIKQGDDWLAQWIPIIQGSPAYQHGGVIFITWDEAELAKGCLANCPIGMIALSPLAKGGGYHNMIAYDHSSTLKTVEEIFHVSPLLQHAGDAGVSDLGDLFTSFP